MTHFHLGIKAAGGGLTTLTGWTSNGHRRRVYPCPGKRADASSILTKSNALTLACREEGGRGGEQLFHGGNGTLATGETLPLTKNLTWKHVRDHSYSVLRP